MQQNVSESGLTSSLWDRRRSDTERHSNSILLQAVSKFYQLFIKFLQTELFQQFILSLYHTSFLPFCHSIRFNSPMMKVTMALNMIMVLSRIRNEKGKNIIPILFVRTSVRFRPQKGKLALHVHTQWNLFNFCCRQLALILKVNSNFDAISSVFKNISNLIWKDTFILSK